ncbi:MAG: aminotransferase class III-fold pyridoxal phosphate-dependent enzyme, partial [Pseudomonadota bacterium]
VFFADNGSGAVEVALKLAYQYHYNKGHSDKTLFLAFEGGYHGDTFGAMATGRTTGFYTPFEPFLCDVMFIPYPDTYIECNDIAEKEDKALKVLENIIHAHQDKICCMILEPLMQGASGMRFARPDFIQKLCDMLRKANILVIFDEVATAFGRTGEMFAFHHLDFIPDFICLSKGLTAGYLPLSVTLTQQHIYDAFLGTDYKSSFTHGHSFTANPLACSAASASLDVFAEEDVLARIRNISEYYYALVPELQKLDMITNIRILGSVLAWDLKIEDRFYKSKSSEKLKDYFLEHGFNIRPLGKSFYLLPPYCITQQQLDKISDAIFNGFA